MSKKNLCLAVAVLAVAQPVWAERNPADPYEPYNRVMFKINDTADKYVMTPITRGYRAVTPRPVRQGVTNFFDNLRDVVSMGSNLLRLDIKRASEDLVRVGVNTTFGLGGLINVADAGGIPNNKNNLGDTFASWGWKNSNYFVYPLTGPSTLRDSIGSTITYAYPVKNAIFETTAGRIGSTVVGGIDTRDRYLDLTDSLQDAAIDKYAYTRDIFMRMRAKQTGARLPQGSDDDIDIDELVGEESGAPETQEYVPAEPEAAVTDLPRSSLDVPAEHTEILTLWEPESSISGASYY